MTQFIRFIRDLIIVIIVLAVFFAVGFISHDYLVKDEPATIIMHETTPDFDLRLPVEVERRVVTVDEVEGRLAEIGELSTYSYEYSSTYATEQTRYFLDDIPVYGTTNSITITCNGVVKAGYDLDAINVRVVDDTIVISLPEAKILDNYVIWDTVVCTENNNILNPIEFSQYQEMVGEIESKGLDQALNGGIYNLAEDHMNSIVQAFLSEFDGYRVEFI